MSNTTKTNLTLKFVSNNIEMERSVARYTTETEYQDWRVEYVDRQGVKGVACNSQELAQVEYLKNLAQNLGKAIEYPVFVAI